MDGLGLVLLAEHRTLAGRTTALALLFLPGLDDLHASQTIDVMSVWLAAIHRLLHGPVYGDDPPGFQGLADGGIDPYIGSMNNALRTQLLEVAEAYCSVKSISLSTLSHKIVNDGKVLDRIKAGRDIHTATFEEFMRWFRNHWPVGVRQHISTVNAILY
jgi:hypothetical protein